MKIFLAWSGGASRKLAETLRKWLPDVIQSAQPFMSHEDVRKGQRWFGEIAGQLEATDFAILCLTPTNLDSPWIHFEAGAVGKHVDRSQVTAALLDVAPTDIDLPLSQFQHTPLTEAEMMKLMVDINALLGERKLDDERLRRAFRYSWPDAQKGFDEARQILEKERTGQAEKPRSQEEILTSLLEVQVGMMKRMEGMEAKLSRISWARTSRAFIGGGKGALASGASLIDAGSTPLPLGDAIVAEIAQRKDPQK